MCTSFQVGYATEELVQFPSVSTSEKAAKRMSAFANTGATSTFLRRNPMVAPILVPKKLKHFLAIEAKICDTTSQNIGQNEHSHKKVRTSPFALIKKLEEEFHSTSISTISIVFSRLLPTIHHG